MSAQLDIANPRTKAGQPYRLFAPAHMVVLDSEGLEVSARVPGQLFLAIGANRLHRLFVPDTTDPDHPTKITMPVTSKPRSYSQAALVVDEVVAWHLTERVWAEKRDTVSVDWQRSWDEMA